jgi:hypothetical protein
MGLERTFATVGYPHVLCSFVYDRKRMFFEELLSYRPATCMGDSGAFSVWTKGETIDVDEYAAWALHYTNLIPGFVTVSLDVLPGRPHVRPSVAARQAGMDQSLANGDRLRAKGLRIVEVFHLHEPIEFFDVLLDRRQPGEMIGLGALAAGTSGPEVRAFCDAAFTHLRDRHGWDALPPVHGFGIAPTSAAGGRYPWWSTDSSSWMSSAQFGKAIRRDGRNNGDDSRTSNRAVRTLYLQRVLESWKRRATDLDRLWASRGVRFAA